MARRIKTVTSTTTEPAETKRNRRTPDQIVAELQAKIDDVKARAAAKEAKANPEGKALLVAAKALDRAIDDCTGDAKRAIEGARAVLSEQLVALGIRTPQAKKHRRAESEAA